MRKLLWINACMRGPEQSRTLGLCRTFLEEWSARNPGGTVTERDLTGGELPVMTAERSEQRDRAARAGELDSPLLAAAVELAGADLVVVGAPCWDLSFPAALKVYLEWASTLGITFRYTQEGLCQGLCRAEKLLYITTSGGPLAGQNFGFEYVKGLGTMLGIPQIQCTAAESLDVWGGPGEENLRRAGEELRLLAARW